MLWLAGTIFLFFSFSMNFCKAVMKKSKDFFLVLYHIWVL